MLTGPVMVDFGHTLNLNAELLNNADITQETPYDQWSIKQL